jgi:hypothetical protein
LASARALFAAKDEIPALMPRSAGAQFALYADCCSGIPGTLLERNFANVNAVVARLTPQPEFIVFPGDNVMGGTPDMQALRSEWRYWLDHEMAWVRKRGIPVYPTTSNHNTYGPESEAVWREIFPDLPPNGPPAQRRLSYWVRRGPVLIVCVNTNFSGIGGHGHVEHEWLDKVLTENADAPFKFATGHVPAFPLNGYGLTPTWRLDPADAAPFWDTLVRHRATAYLCSHVLAFDFQVHQGIPQITSGGAGTWGNFPRGLMPGTTEYLHAVQMAVDAGGLRYQVLDTTGRVRESLAWPFPLSAAANWRSVPEDDASKMLRAGIDFQARQEPWITAWRFAGTTPAPAARPQTLLSGYDTGEPDAAFRVAFAGTPPRLMVWLQTQSGEAASEWHGPEFRPGERFGFHLALHSGMGPGGVLYRSDENAPWTSLTSASPRGCEHLPWPPVWMARRGHYGPDHDVYPREGTLEIAWTGMLTPPPL